MRELTDILADLPTDEQERFSHRFVNIGRDPLRCPKIIIPIGPPCSGKSTWTDAYMALEGRRPTMIASTDNQIELYAKMNGLTYEQAMGKLDFKQLEQAMNGVIQAAVKIGADIIIDRTNVRSKARRRWLSQVPRHYVRIGLVFEVRSEVIFERLARRERESAIGKRVPADVVKNMIETYQAPTLDEFDIIETFNNE